MAVNKYTGVVQDADGVRIAGASITVTRDSDSQSAALFEDVDKQVVSSNPALTGADGRFQFYVDDTEGTLTFTVTSEGVEYPQVSKAVSLIYGGKAYALVFELAEVVEGGSGGSGGHLPGEVAMFYGTPPEGYELLTRKADTLAEQQALLLTGEFYQNYWGFYKENPNPGVYPSVGSIINAGVTSTLYNVQAKIDADLDFSVPVSSFSSHYNTPARDYTDDGRYLLLFGRYDNPTGTEVLVNSVDLTTGASTTLAAANASVGWAVWQVYASAVNVGNNQFMVTHFNYNDSYTSAVSLYDYNSNTWSFGANRPNGVRGGKLVLLPDGKVLAVGGTTADGGLVAQGKDTFSTQCDIYDPAADSWTPAASLDLAKTNYDSSVGFTVCNGPVVLYTLDKVVIALGEYLGVYTIATDSWSYIPLGNTFYDSGNWARPTVNHYGFNHVIDAKDGSVFVYQYGTSSSYYQNYLARVVINAGEVDQKQLTYGRKV